MGNVSPAEEPPRRRVPRAERELQMLAVAEEVFAERGYAAAAMEEIAERVGVSKPMLYEYFGSKDGLLLAAIARVKSQLLKATASAIDGVTDPEDQLRRGLVAFFEFMAAHERSWLVVLQESAVVPGPVTEELEATRRQQTDFLAAMLATHVPHADALHLEAYAEILVGACERLALWRARTGGVTTEHATERLMESFWYGLARPRTTC